MERIEIEGRLSGTGSVEEHFSFWDPHWDPNTGAGRTFLTGNQKFVSKHATLKAINWSKLDEVKQELHKILCEFV